MFREVTTREIPWDSIVEEFREIPLNFEKFRGIPRNAEEFPENFQGTPPDL